MSKNEMHVGWESGVNVRVLKVKKHDMECIKFLHHIFPINGNMIATLIRDINNGENPIIHMYGLPDEIIRYKNAYTAFGEFFEYEVLNTVKYGITE